MQNNKRPNHSGRRRASGSSSFSRGGHSGSRSTHSRGGTGHSRGASHARPYHAHGARGAHTAHRSSRSSGRRVAEMPKHDLSAFINKAAPTAPEAPIVITHEFKDFAILPELKTAIAKKGYVTPTPIQDQAIPHILKGTDVVGIANTGTGKTGAFLIPLVNAMLNDRRTRALVIAPTRELAQQIED